MPIFTVRRESTILVKLGTAKNLKMVLQRIAMPVISQIVRQAGLLMGKALEALALVTTVVASLWGQICDSSCDFQDFLNSH